MAIPATARATGRAFWKADWVIGLTVAVIFAVLALAKLGPLVALEGKAYDAALRWSQRAAADDIAIIAIDDASLANIGRWPWSREVHAKMIDYVASGKPKVIAHLALFSEPERDRGLDYIEKLRIEVDAAAKSGTDIADGPLARIDALLKEADEALNTDRKLAASITRAGNVIGPVVFKLDDLAGADSSEKKLPDFIERNTLRPQGSIPGREFTPLNTGSTASFPIDSLGRAFAGLGHLNANADADGVYRSSPLVVSHYGFLFPSLALATSARALGVKQSDIKVDFGSPLQLGRVTIDTVERVQMRPYFYQPQGGRPAFHVDSFFDVVAGKIPADKFRDKIVLIGPTALGLGTEQPTPVDAATPAVYNLAHQVSSILRQDFVLVPAWAEIAPLVALVVVALYLMFGLPRLKAAWAAAVTAGMLAALIAVPFIALTARPGVWVQLAVPALALLVGHIVLTTTRFFASEAGKVRADADSAESNRMLGLAFQGQGQLDLAFDKFRKCPMNDALMDNLYGLALDFERKRQFNKAESVFRFMADHDPKYRDLSTRLPRMKQLSETVILGGAPKSGGGTQILTGGGVEKPMLGRYEIEREIGRGAMGAVYLGRDPKIGRVVAIKTLALGDEFAGDELAEAKGRFFREAETAGRLNHPNIVTIFDAGEEHDLAYIAMEFLKGKDLTGHTKPDNILPLPTVLSILARVADGLDYAHKQNIVHRDIKPGNIMYDRETDAVKVTDFGIARITDSSRTKTGMVLGTPTFMSPEQLSGKKVDGRSDLFSLGVTLFQMACGRAPFTGDSMAQLMFKIANEPTPDITAFNPNLPRQVSGFLMKALAKEPADRFQSGAEFAALMRRLAEIAAKGQPDRPPHASTATMTAGA